MWTPERHFQRSARESRRGERSFLQCLLIEYPCSQMKPSSISFYFSHARINFTVLIRGLLFLEIPWPHILVLEKSTQPHTNLYIYIYMCVWHDSFSCVYTSPPSIASSTSTTDSSYISTPTFLSLLSIPYHDPVEKKEALKSASTLRCVSLELCISSSSNRLTCLSFLHHEWTYQK